MNQTVSIIIRTLPGREHFLDKCLFILSGQNYQDIEPIVVAQYHSSEQEIEQISAIIEKWKYFFPLIKLIHYPSQTDTRSHSLNLGIQAATGRYLAFLDDDDKLYPQHYENLVSLLQSTNFSWAYSQIVRADFNEDGQLISRSFPYHRECYLFTEHLRGNFIPIHAPLIDLERIPAFNCFFNENLTKLEDYDFWLRLAYKYQPIYSNIISGEYCIRGDGSNTVISESKLTKQEFLKKQHDWQQATLEVNELKIKQFGWWITELDTSQPIHLPLFLQRTTSSLTLKALEQIYSSYTWKLIRLGKKINWKLRSQAKKHHTIPADSATAEKELVKIIHSPEWLLLSPIYFVECCLRKIK